MLIISQINNILKLAISFRNKTLLNSFIQNATGLHFNKITLNQNIGNAKGLGIDLLQANESSLDTFSQVLTKYGLKLSDFINDELGSTKDWLKYDKELDKIYNPEISQLEKDLRKSANWQLIFSDSMANIWENLSMR